MVNNLGLLYADLRKLDEAEKDVLAGAVRLREGAGPELVKTYVPALNTVQSLAVLYE
jgi:hypothetical protein